MNQSRVMTQLTVNIEDVSMLEQIKQAISLLKGVSSVTLKKTRKKGVVDETEYLMSSPAMADVIRQGQADIKDGKGQLVELDELWK